MVVVVEDGMHTCILATQYGFKLLQYLFYDVNREMLVKVLNGGLVFQLLIIDGNDGNINIIIAFP